MVEEKPKEQPAVFIGRKRLLDDLAKAMNETEGGMGRFFLVSGEGGVGKTALVRKVMETAIAKGWTVMASECLFGGGGMPFQPILHALATSRTMNSEKGPVPTLTMGLAGIEGDPWYQGRGARTVDELQAERDKMFENVADQLADISRKTPVLLVIEDMHRADVSTCQMLHFLVRSLADQRVLVLGTYRPEESGTDKDARPLLEMRSRLLREALVRPIELKNLSEAETGQLLNELSGYEVPGMLVNRIHRDTGGSPYYITELIAALKASGPTGEMLGDKLTVPSSVTSFIMSKLEHLSADELKLLQFGSVMGQEFQLDVLLKASNMPDLEVVQHIERLMNQRLISEVVSGDKISYRFLDNFVPEVVNSKISRSKRRLMHRLIAAAMEASAPSDPDRSVYQLAYHYSQGADAVKALHYDLLAGNKAADSFAVSEARRYFSEALDLLSKQEESEVSIAMEASLLVKLGLLAEIQGDSRAALKYNQEALALTKEGTKEWAATMRRISSAEYMMDHWKASEEILTKIIKVCESLNDFQGLAETYYLLGQTNHKLGRPKEVFKYCDLAIEYGKRSKDRRLIGKALIIEGNTKCELQPDYEESMRLHNEALKNFDPIKDMDQITREYNNIGDLYRLMGDFKKAIDCFEKGLTIIGKTGDLVMKAYINSNLGLVHQAMGDRKAAHRHYEEAIKICQRIGLMHILAMTHQNLASIAREAGDLATAEAELNEAFKAIEGIEFKHGLAHLYLELGLLWKAKGDMTQARDNILRGMGLIEEIGQTKDQKRFQKELDLFDK